MSKVTEGYFENPGCGKMTFGQVIEEIISYIQKDTEKEYDVVVGCDSSSDQDPLFPIAIVVLRKGNGGRFFLKKMRFKEERKIFRTWKMRILREVMELDKVPDYEFKYIHADVGNNGATREMIKEVIGLIKGNGFEPKIKPESFVASGVADKYC
jgi:predicted RNase H-related nuclease YkuK (DUF458 family)